MSATNTKGGDRPRNANDAYETDPRLALAIARQVRAAFGEFDLVVEPSAGGGAFVRAARQTWRYSRIVAIEPFGAHARPHVVGGVATPLHDAGADGVLRTRWEDYVEAWEPPAEQRRLTLANPPFALGEAHIRLALERSRVGDVVAMLLRGSMLASAARVRGLWRAWPPSHVWNLAPRPSFTGGGSDSAEYVVVAWSLPCTGAGYVGGWLDWRPVGIA